MSSSFAGSFNQFGGEARPFDDGFLASDSFSNFSSTPFLASGGDFHSDSSFFLLEENANGPILSPPAEMGTEEGYALREWRRQNAIRLEKKEKQEKELLRQIIAEAEEYKVEFHKKRQLTCAANKATNREKEKVFVASLQKFHAEADKDYWKSISELIPKEVPAVEHRKGKKEHEKKPAVVVIQGPKPGKRTDLSRMRQLLIKLKHNTPPHLKPSPSGAKLDTVFASSNRPAAMASSTDAVAVA